MAQPRLISGIQPTGRLHLGNYLGALKNFVGLEAQGDYECYFFIADLHSLTENYTPAEKRMQIIELAADFLAAGLDPKKSVTFQQSQIPASSELAWILNTITPLGELRRMTQFKEKSDGEKESANAGLLTYPTLMAADILLYDAKFVPVGEDQQQHLELARTLARKFNSRFGKTFIEPQAVFTETPRVMNLDDPTKKMSKSRHAGCLFIDDSPEAIKAKIMRAVTDSGNEIKYDPVGKPAVSSLLKVYSSLSGETIPHLEKKFTKQNYAQFKAALAELIADHFADYRKKKKALMAKPKALEAVLAAGSKKAEKIAEKKISDVKKKIGLAA